MRFVFPLLYHCLALHGRAEQYLRSGKSAKTRTEQLKSLFRRNRSRGSVVTGYCSLFLNQELHTCWQARESRLHGHLAPPPPHHRPGPCTRWLLQDLNGTVSVSEEQHPEMCGIFCKSLNFPFFGVGWSRECSCGTSYGSLGRSYMVRVLLSWCRMYCTGLVYRYY